jgi:hypothetical protein
MRAVAFEYSERTEESVTDKRAYLLLGNLVVGQRAQTMEWEESKDGKREEPKDCTPVPSTAALCLQRCLSSHHTFRQISGLCVPRDGLNWIFRVDIFDTSSVTTCTSALLCIEAHLPQRQAERPCFSQAVRARTPCACRYLNVCTHRFARDTSTTLRRTALTRPHESVMITVVHPRVFEPALQPQSSGSRLISIPFSSPNHMGSTCVISGARHGKA